ncbi:protease complex subunit PrcB family protein [Flavobacterium ardleyense]|uniref:protease complex subunit PrcB family protein n=1 Tax=Flavobacterium ardleyense TaxID=2038737 RepID=UPI00298CA699|nr:protease complex subunit PrcB family protein [Flavobacterium ardleyense]
MKKVAILLSGIFIVACSSQKNQKDSKHPLYEVLLQSDQDGADIQFYEILSEANEITMLLGDPDLRKKINEDDIKTANFVILNMGEKTSAGYSIGVDSVVEEADKIILTVKENSPQKGAMTASVMTYPFAIVKINSKKKIEIK